MPCKPSKGIEFRKRLHGKASLFKVPRLYSVTVAREWHDSPAAAHDHVMRGGFLRRLFRLVGVERWVWVLEPQEESGDGWPHWHCLVDVGDLPGKWYHSGRKVAVDERPAGEEGWRYIPHFFDLNRVHELLARWKVGRQCRLSVRRDSFTSAAHAVNYITKYLVKVPRRGYPQWMLERRRLRFVGASKALGPLVAGKGEEGAEGEEGGLERGTERVPIERISECGMALRLLQYNERTGGVEQVGGCLSPREGLWLCTWAQRTSDFDFESGRAFDVWGFASRSQGVAFALDCLKPAWVKWWKGQVAWRRECLWWAWEERGAAMMEQGQASAGPSCADLATPQNSSERGGLGAIGSADCSPPPLSVRVA